MKSFGHYRIGGAFALALLASSLPVSALSPPPPEPDDQLLPLLYETLGGEQWQRSDDWFDPDVHWCDWYGVTCGEDSGFGYREFLGLELPANNLAGEISTELGELLFLYMTPTNKLDLSDNRISGPLPHFPQRALVVDLSGNQLSGALPEIVEEPVMPERPRRLLARNDFEGTVPESWQQLDLTELDLADNRLDDGYLNAFDAMSRVNPGHLDLAGNQFSGELPIAVLPAKLNRRDSGNTGGGLDLCFNDFVVDNPDVAQWVADRHAGGPDYEQCLGRERLPVDPTVSGSWFNPDRSGEGVALMLLENGAPLLYHFGFDTEGRQQWLFEVGNAGERYLVWDWLLQTQGTFNAGLRFDGDYPFVRGVARFRMDRVGDETIHLYRFYYDLSGCGEWEYADPNRPPPPGLCFPSLTEDRMDYRQLSRMAGTSCDNQNGWQAYSGAWFNSDRSGEGFILEVLPDGQAVVYWFTHKPDGSREQAWLIGQGMIEELVFVTTPPPGTAVLRLPIDEMLMPLGGQYGPEFDPDEINYVDWGSIVIDLDITGEDNPRVSWDSHIAGYGSGSYELERLARPMLAECE
ncbi:MAG: hypothetical protein GVY32_12970 [Gammaproteobacteria bacterium]|jgi:hypothetical protein|nr:hypothetical protein [Gammaproteobacteria bacterium]